MKEESEKVGLKCNIQKMKIMASGPITSWQIDGETVETLSDFIFLGSNIMSSGAITSWEIDGETVEQCQTLFRGAPKSLQMVIAAMKLKDAYSLEGKL